MARVCMVWSPAVLGEVAGGGVAVANARSKVKTAETPAASVSNRRREQPSVWLMLVPLLREAVARCVRRLPVYCAGLHCDSEHPRPVKVSRMSRKLMSLVALLIALYLLLCGALFVFQRSLIYFPQPDSAVATTDSRLKLTMPDADVWVATRAHVGPKALIYFGGNAEDVSRNLPSFSEAFPDYALFLLNYRGFGGSGGSPSEEAIAEDALALFDQVYASHPQIAVIGRSLGSGVAVRLASQRPAKQLILVTPYNSLEDIAVRQYPWMPVKWLLKDRFESGRYAAHIRVPTLLLAASDDEVIPRDSTQRLLQSFPKGVATLRVVPDAGHNSISERAQYLQWMEDVLDR